MPAKGPSPMTTRPFRGRPREAWWQKLGVPGFAEQAACARWVYPPRAWRCHAIWPCSPCSGSRGSQDQRVSACARRKMDCRGILKRLRASNGGLMLSLQWVGGQRARVLWATGKTALRPPRDYGYDEHLHRLNEHGSLHAGVCRQVLPGVPRCALPPGWTPSDVADVARRGNQG